MGITGEHQKQDIQAAAGVEIIMAEFSGYVCDNLCRYPRETSDQDELHDICSGCEMQVYLQEILGIYYKK